MRYRYKAFGQGGRRLTGEIEAQGSRAAMAKLRGQGLLVEHLRVAPSLKLNFHFDLGGPKLGLRQQAILFNLLGMLVDGGVPILQSLQVLAGTTRGPMRAVVERLAHLVEDGQTLSQAMGAQGKVFSRLAVQLVLVAEMTGDLETGLRLLASQYDTEDQIRRRFKSAMTYPVVVLVMAIGLAVFMTLFLVPNFAGMFRDLGAELPWQTRALLSVSDFVKQQGITLVFLTAMSVTLVRYILRRSEPFRVNVHRAILRLPVFGALIWNRETARYCRTLGTMLKTGVPVVQATQTSADVLENAFLGTRLAAVPEAISNGASLGQAVKESGAIPPILSELLTVGEMIGESDTTLRHIADLCDSDVKQTLDRLTSILEPVLILLLGGIVLCVVVPLLLPMFDVYANIR